MANAIRRILKGSCFLALAGILAAQSMPTKTTDKIKGASSSSIEQLRGTVEYVQDNTLVVKMASGERRTFNPPPSRRFIVDGNELPVSALKPGTRLTATVVTTKTAFTDRVTTVGTGKVWYVAPPSTVILTLPNGENRQYKVKSDYKFSVGGQPATVFDLRKGMTVAAEKIEEIPGIEIASNTTVTGTAPPEPKPAVAREATPAPAPARTAAAARPEPAPAPAPRAATPEPVQVAERAKTLPKTASPFPLIGLAGLLCGAASLVIRKLR